MKKYLLLLSYGIFFTATLFSQNKIFSFEIEPLFGIRNGTVSEYVYSKNSQTGSEYHLSLLDWDLKNSLYYGIAGDFGIKDFHASINFKNFIPGESGRLQDSDWLQDTGYHTGRTDIKTNYSVHNNTLLEGLNLEGKIRYNFHPTRSFSLAPTAGVSYENYHFIGANGRKWYGTNNPNVPLYDPYNACYYPYNDPEPSHVSTGTFSGAVIELERYDFYVWLGLSADYKTADEKWQFGFDFEFSPYTYIISIDSHLERTPPRYFLDISEVTFSSFKGNAFAQLNFTKIMALKINLNFLVTGELKGIEYVSSSRHGKFNRNSSSIGSSTRYFDFQVSAAIRF